MKQEAIKIVKKQRNELLAALIQHAENWDNFPNKRKTILPLFKADFEKLKEAEIILRGLQRR